MRPVSFMRGDAPRAPDASRSNPGDTPFFTGVAPPPPVPSTLGPRPVADLPSRTVLLRTRASESFNRLHAVQLVYLPRVRRFCDFLMLSQVLCTTQFPV